MALFSNGWNKFNVVQSLYWVISEKKIDETSNQSRKNYIDRPKSSQLSEKINKQPTGLLVG